MGAQEAAISWRDFDILNTEYVVCNMPVASVSELHCDF